MPHIDSHKKHYQSQLGIIPGDNSYHSDPNSVKEGQYRWQLFDESLSPEDLTFEQRYRIPNEVPNQTHRQRMYRLPNGIEASVINDGYGSQRGRYEMWESDKAEVEGRLFPYEVIGRLREAAARFYTKEQWAEIRAG